MPKNITYEQGVNSTGNEFVTLTCICGTLSRVVKEEDFSKEYMKNLAMYKLNRLCRFKTNNSCKRVYHPSCVQKIKDIKMKENEIV